MTKIVIKQKQIKGKNKYKKFIKWQRHILQHIAVVVCLICLLLLLLI